MSYNPRWERVSPDVALKSRRKQNVKTLKARSTVSDPIAPVWCHRCSVRIAPYERRTLKKGKSYHPGCYSKMNAGSSGQK